MINHSIQEDYLNVKVINLRNHHNIKDVNKNVGNEYHYQNDTHQPAMDDNRYDENDNLTTITNQVFMVVGILKKMKKIVSNYYKHDNNISDKKYVHLKD